MVFTLWSLSYNNIANSGDGRRKIGQYSNCLLMPTTSTPDMYIYDLGIFLLPTDFFSYTHTHTHKALY